jgi:hypothetical protein
MCLVFASLAFYYFYRYLDTQRIENIGQTEYAIPFYVRGSTSPPDEVLGFFERVAEEYQVSVIKITEEFQDDRNVLIHSGVFYPETYPSDQLSISAGTFPFNHEGFLATYQSGTEGQAGYLFSFAQSSAFILQSLERYYGENDRVDGNYMLVSTVAFDGPGATRALSEYFEVDTEALLRQSTSKASSPEFPFYLFAVCFALMVLVFLLLAVVIPISKVREGAIKRLLGYSNIAIWFSSIQSMAIVAFSASAVFDVVLMILIKGFSFEFIVAMLGIQVFVTLLLVAASSITLLMLVTRKTGDMLKKSVSMKGSLICAVVLKATIALSIAMLSAPAADDAVRAANEYRSQAQWLRYGDYSVMLSMKLAGDDRDSIASGDKRLNDRFAALYDDLNDRLDGIYVTSNDYPGFRIDETPVPGTSLEESFQSLKVNPNYLKAFPLQDTKGTVIAVPETEHQRVLLVPDSRADDAEALAAVFLKQTTEYVESLAGRYATDAASPEEAADRPDARSLSYKVIIYHSEDPMFSFDDNVGKSTNLLLHDPVIEVITKENILQGEKGALLSSGLDFPMKLDLSRDDARVLLAAIIQEKGLTDNAPVFDTIKNGKAQQVAWTSASLLLFVGGILVIFLLGLLSSFFLFSIIILARHRWLYVGKYLGYSLSARYRQELVFFAALYALVVICFWLATQSGFGLIILTAIALFDAVVTLLIITRIERRNLASQMKGA